jgi:hypothetical protein
VIAAFNDLRLSAFEQSEIVAEGLAKWCDRSRRSAQRIFTANPVARWNVADDGEFFLRLQTTNGGSSDSDKKELTVNPSRFSPSKVVTTATPVAKRLMAVRNSQGSIAVGAA